MAFDVDQAPVGRHDTPYPMEGSILQTIKKPVTRDLLLLGAVVLLLTVPFLKQPFHLDDRDFVNFARIAASYQKTVYKEDYTYLGFVHPLADVPDSHGPLLTTTLSGMLRLGSGYNEALFHFVYLIFPLIGAVSMYSLARRFTRWPLATALLLIFTPGFLVTSHTLMGNLPGLALVLAGAALYIHGVDRWSWKLLTASVAALILTGLTAFQALSVVPALLLYGATHRPVRYRAFLPFILLAVAGLAWFGITFLVVHRLPPVIYRLKSVSYHTELGETYSGHILQARAMLTFIGGAAIFPLSILVLFLRKKADVLTGFILLPPIIIWAGLYYAGQGKMTLAQGLQVALLASAGCMLVYGFLARTIPAVIGEKGKDRSGSIFLLAWFASSLAIYLVCNIPYVSVRHLLLFFPPLVLVFMREVEAAWSHHTRWRNGFIVLTLLLTLTGGLAAAIADYRFAAIYPRLADDLKDKYGGAGKVWIRGEFDFRYYLEQAGFSILNDKSDVKPGDIIVYSDFASSVIVAPWPKGNYKELSRETPEDSFPFRIMNRAAGAGFYGDPMGPLPLAWSQDPLDVVIVYQFEGQA